MYWFIIRPDGVTSPTGAGLFFTLISQWLFVHWPNHISVMRLCFEKVFSASNFHSYYISVTVQLFWSHITDTWTINIFTFSSFYMFSVYSLFINQRLQRHCHTCAGTGCAAYCTLWFIIDAVICSRATCLPTCSCKVHLFSSYLLNDKVFVAFWF